MEDTMSSTTPLPDESWNPPVIQPEHGSDAPDTVDESLIPEGKEPQVFDQPTGMNMPPQFEELPRD
jgi:hypothetical protein